MIYIHTGLLARMDNEAQLATLLAHEMTHAKYRYLVKEFRDINNKTAFLAASQLAFQQLGQGTGYCRVLGVVGTLAAARGYSREPETEADMEGLKLVTKAGYDLFEALKLFEYLKSWLEENKVKEPFFFGTAVSVPDERESGYSVVRVGEKEKGCIAATP